MLELHLGQIHLELLGQQHRHGGVRPLAHLDLVHDQRHPPVAIDADEGIGGEPVGAPTPARGQREAEQQATSDGGADLEECPTRQCGSHLISLPPV